MDKDTSAYRMALERGVYGSLGPEFESGLNQINGQLAGAGPLADSGAAVALRQKLAGNIYSRAAGQIGEGMSGFVGNYLGNQQQFRNQMALLRYQKSLQPSGLSQFAGKAVGTIGGALLGRPQQAQQSPMYSYPRYDSQTGGY